MKKIMILILMLLVVPTSIKAVSVKETIIESMDEVSVNDKLDLKIKVNFSELDKADKNGMGVALVYYELLFDDEVFSIVGIDSNDWNTTVYKDIDNRYYAISFLSKNASNNKCVDNSLYCGDYEVAYDLYVKETDTKETEIKIGDVEIGLLPMTNSKKELTEEDVVLINVSGKSNKNLKIKNNSEKKLGEIKELVIEKDKVEITKQMVLESKDNTYSLAEKDNYLEKIIIDDYDLDFKKYTNDYNLKIKEKDKKLNISVELSNKEASYEIIGNENLTNGSEIKINVKAKNEEINTYTIKISQEKEIIQKEEKRNDFLGINIDFSKIDYKLVGIIVGSIIGLIILIKLMIKLHDRKLEKAIKKL